MTCAFVLSACLVLATVAPVAGQTRPQTPPPPRPGVTPDSVDRGGSEPVRQAAPPPVSAPARQTPPPSTISRGAGTTSAAAAAAAPVQTTVPQEAAPTEALLGVPVYPAAKFLRSFDAGQGQRYYLFGTTQPFGEVVLYYRNQLRQRGDLVYDEPPVHMFEVGRFREESMAFPPGVTVKDYTWGGKPGYLVPVPGANPSHYPTIIQIVPVVGR